MPTRIAFLDWLRAIACFMVVLAHACEPFYFGDDGGFFIPTLQNALAVVGIDSALRASVPLFVIASTYLLFPVARPTPDFLKRRLLRVALPFAIWALAYNFAFGGNPAKLLFNFPADIPGGHLWFVPMLLGLYLLMPLLSPWAERVTAKELRCWIACWGFTTLFPYLRLLWTALFGAPSFGSVPFLYGECPWNSFGAFHYVSGFFGYMLVGLWFRKFAPELTWRQTLKTAIPLWTLGYAAVALPFLLRIPAFPAKGPYALAVNLETSWEFCSTGVALTAVAYFMVIRKLASQGAVYRRIVRPLSDASYGIYLSHMFILVPVCAHLKPHLPAPLAIPAIAAAAFLASTLLSLTLKRLPLLNRLLT